MACLQTQQKRRLEFQTLYNAGITNAKDISSWIHVPERTVFRVLALIQKIKGLDHRQGAGAPRKIPPNDKRRISNILKSTPRISVRQLTTRLESNVGESTVHRYLMGESFVKSPAIRVPALTDLQIQKRIKWCGEMKGFDWSKTFFTDECSIWLDSGKVIPTDTHPKFMFGVGFL